MDIQQLTPLKLLKREAKISLFKLVLIVPPSSTENALNIAYASTLNLVTMTRTNSEPLEPGTCRPPWRPRTKCTSTPGTVSLSLTQCLGRDSETVPGVDVHFVRGLQGGLTVSHPMSRTSILNIPHPATPAP